MAASIPSAYVESTIPSYLTARVPHDMVIARQQQMTIEWWNTAPSRYDLLISQTVLDEIAAGDPKAVERRLASLQSINVLPLDPEVAPLAREYARLLHLPQKAYNDGVHLAYAVVFEVDYVVTWNMRHLANSATMRAITKFNVMRSLYVPLIVTPEYLLDLTDSAGQP